MQKYRIFLICFFGSIVLDYTTSWALEKLFHAYWWDYSDVICNINGRVCLPASIGFGLAGILVFYALDKADLFNAKADRRNQRIREIFDLRIQDVRDKTEIATAAACEAARDSRIKLMKLFEGITNASENNDYAALKASVSGLYQLLLEKNIEIPSEDNKWDC